MSFWSKKPDTQQIPDSVTEKLSEITNTYANIELRLQKLEEGSNKREKFQFTEVTTRVDELAASTQERLDRMNKQILSVTNFIPTAFKEYQILLEGIQHKQNVLEERIAVYDEKLEKLKELTDRLEEQLKKPTPVNNSPTGQAYKPSPLTRSLAEQTLPKGGPVSTISPTGPVKTFVGQTGGTKTQPSWIKKKVEDKPKEEDKPAEEDKPKEELHLSINSTVVREA